MSIITLRLGTGEPDPAVLDEGEPAIDKTLAAPKLYARLNGATRLLADPSLIENLRGRIILLEERTVELQNRVTELEARPRITVSDTAPPNPRQGDLWYDSVWQEMLIFYVDQTSSQWVGIV